MPRATDRGALAGSCDAAGADVGLASGW
jgi:hypothetical protein